MTLLAYKALLAAAIAIPVGLAADRTQHDAMAPGSAWREIAWPLPRDQFPAGRAFACDESACGPGVRITVRPKVGFCDCLTGVSDDDELERVGDADLLAPDAQASEPGREIVIGAMKGRARFYDIGRPGAREAVASIAFNKRCDVVVATATRARPKVAEQAIFAFLNSPRILTWIEKDLGL